MSMTETASRTAAPVDMVPELVASLAVIVLSIFGLAQGGTYLLGIAVIVFGVALLLFGGGAMTTIHRQIGRTSQTVALGTMGGWSMVFLAGFAGIVLGVLAVINIAPMQLVSIALIAFGGALLLSSRAARALQLLVLNSIPTDPIVQQFVEDMSVDSAGLQAMGGLAAVVLGILALTGVASQTLVFAGLLALGCVAALSAVFIGEGLVRVMQKAT